MFLTLLPGVLIKEKISYDPTMKYFLNKIDSLIILALGNSYQLDEKEKMRSIMINLLGSTNTLLRMLSTILR